MSLGSHSIGAAPIGSVIAASTSGPAAQTYPLLGVEYRIWPAIARVVSIANGLRAMSLGHTEAYEIELIHPLMTTTERDQLKAFYAANRTTVSTIDLAGERYSIRFGSAYKVERVNSLYSNVSVSMIGVK